MVTCRSWFVRSPKCHWEHDDGIQHYSECVLFSVRLLRLAFNFPIFFDLQYCLVALLYDPLVQGTGLLDLFLEGVIGCQGAEDKRQFLENISQMPNTIHVTKFNELWSAHDEDELNVANTMNVKKLCARLNGQTIDDHNLCTTSLDHDIEESDSDGWESFDENESDDDPYDGGTATEVENTLNLSDALEKLKMEFGF